MGVSLTTRIPWTAACVCTTASLFEPYATTIAVGVAVGDAVGVSVIYRKPMPATAVASAASIFDPYWMTTAVGVGVPVLVTVCVDVAV